ncbi:MAG: lipoyl synthase [Arenicellales bacterium]|jgi:lipoic acid synthetase|nr:lipoyl synthase [Arenicellales bacterium]MDP7155008.1 lipoyl synthase [Arenicellales bacterium]MDP7282823.1 lipoyl synthase [Arenicellales bacterium]MDP7482326.1 lipoyl synthase [Arenicellales bacterium]HJL66017.1 lipoyl synthase [Arenicellales bacterium]|tara:strand:+ start:5198 stop:6172 length:975 start_codon:yes stop_codon:yes gene_type:complete
MNVKSSINTTRGEKQRGKAKTARVPEKFSATTPDTRLLKPAWIRVRFPGSQRARELKSTLREAGLHSVCEEANCPNLGECFDNGTATFMILGDICTRRCPFCDVAHGKPLPPDPAEARNLARTVGAMKLDYVVITSVDRDDLRDGGASHYSLCIEQLRQQCPKTMIEILTPDYRGRLEAALSAHDAAPPDVFNHNLETVPRLYRRVRPGADYHWSLNLLKTVRQRHPDLPTKSGLMLGLGEALEEVEEVMVELRNHQVTMLTLGQYLQPGPHHLPVERYVTPAEFDSLAELGRSLGFKSIASAPLVRSSYHAEQQAACREDDPE